MLSIQTLIISVIVLALVGIIAFVLSNRQKKSAENNQTPKSEKGCSILFYVFLALLVAFFAIGYYLYSK